MIHILIHRCGEEDMYKAYDSIERHLLNTCPLPIKRNKPAAIIYVSGLMELKFRSGHDARNLKGLRPDYINADSYIVSDEMSYRCTQDNPIIDDIYKFIDRFIKNYNENSERDNIFRFINQAIKTHIENTGSGKIKFVCNEAIEPYAREYFKDSDVEIVVTKAYEEVEERND